MISAMLEAAAPGMQGRGGIMLTAKLRKALAQYFKGLSQQVDLSDMQEGHSTLVAARILPLITKASAGLQRLLETYARAGYEFTGKLTAMHESASDTDSASIKKLIAQMRRDDEVAKLDRLGETGTAAAAYAAARAAQSVTEINDVTRTKLQELIERGILQKRGVGGLARDIRSELNDMSVQRAKLIAVTEMNTAMSTATFAKIKRIGLTYKRWIDHEGACEICRGNKAQGAIPVDQPFASGVMHSPGHPRCKCSVAGVRDERKDEYGDR